MESPIHAKAETHVLLCRCGAQLIELKGGSADPRSDRSTTGAFTHSELSLHRKLLRHTGQVCFHVCELTDIQQQAQAELHTKQALYTISLLLSVYVWPQKTKLTELRLLSA